MNVNELDTPAAFVDIDLLEANIARSQEYLSAHNIAARPHIKGHKIPQIAHKQIAAGAVGITCQKLSEAEIMIQAGIRDIFIPYNIVGETKLRRLARLCGQASLSVAADSEYTIRGLAEAAAQSGVALPTLVEIDIGGGRCGVQTPGQAAGLARAIASSPGLQFAGLMAHPSNERTDPFVRETRRLLKSDGLAIERVSEGGTLGLWRAHTHSELTEYRVGTYVYGDRSTVRHGALPLESCSFRLAATVVSRPTADRAIMDAGSKALSSATLGLEGYGYVLEFPEIRIYNLDEEHGYLDVSRCRIKPGFAERLTIVPNHSCEANNLFSEVAAVRNGEVKETWTVAARGALQ